MGIEVKRTPKGSLVLSQAKYIRELLAKAALLDSNSIGTPMMSSCKLSKFGTNSLSDPHLYRSVVGALQYVTITRPEIAFSVNKVCQFMAHPLEDHWKAVKRILRYLKGTLSYGLELKPAANTTTVFSLCAFSDADWASDPDDRRSTSGYCLFFGPNLVSWSSKKQALVARSTTEAEYRSMAHATAELLWVQSLLQEIRISFTKPVLYCDNMSAIALSHNPVLHARTKHMELDIHFVREKVVSKDLLVEHVPVAQQVADILTKPLSSSQFPTMRCKLNVASHAPPP